MNAFVERPTCRHPLDCLGPRVARRGAMTCGTFRQIFNIAMSSDRNSWQPDRAGARWQKTLLVSPHSVSSA